MDVLAVLLALLNGEKMEMFKSICLCFVLKSQRSINSSSKDIPGKALQVFSTSSTRYVFYLCGFLLMQV